jgi:hypothetical protein
MAFGMALFGVARHKLGGNPQRPQSLRSDPLLLLHVRDE